MTFTVEQFIFGCTISAIVALFLAYYSNRD